MAAPTMILLNLTVDGDGMVQAKYPQMTFPGTSTVAEIKQTVRENCQITSASATLRFFHSGQEWSDSIQLGNTGVQQGDQVRCIVEDRTQVNAFGANQVAEIPMYIRQLLSADPSMVIAQLVADSQQMTALMQNQPTLAQAVFNNDIFAVSQWQQTERNKWQARINQEQQRVANLNNNFLDGNAQARILEEIRLAEVEKNRAMAMEHYPESFARVIMLYVPLEVNGHKLQAFVDSGAQNTIISKSLAAKVGILRLLDRRYAGVAKGVGTSRILGRIHLTEIKFGNLKLPCSFIVMDDSMELLFGLDMLKRHQASIDLENRCLRLRGESVPFLTEAEIPHLRNQNRAEAGLSPRASSMSIDSVPATTANDTATTSSPAPQVEPQPVQPLAQPSQPVASNNNSGSQFPEAHIIQLTGLGFARNDVIQALFACGGNVEMAASMLYSF